MGLDNRKKEFNTRSARSQASSAINAITETTNKVNDLNGENVDDIIDDSNPHIARGETGKKKMTRILSTPISSEIYDILTRYQQTQAKRCESQRYIAEKALMLYFKEQNFI